VTIEAELIVTFQTTLPHKFFRPIFPSFYAKLGKKSLILVQFLKIELA
jgi:hypothetical protein